MMTSGYDPKLLVTLALMASIRRDQMVVVAELQRKIDAFNSLILELKSGRHNLGSREQACINLCRRAENVLKDCSIDSLERVKQFRRVTTEFASVLRKHNEDNSHRKISESMIQALQ